MNLVLTGMMGTGKTTVGKMLADKLGMEYVSTDEMIEEKVKMTIPEIFRRKGEEYFRDLETKVVKSLSERDNLVIDTGGGIVQRSENMDELEKNGIIVCLTATVDTILERTRGTDYRPLLNVENPRAEIEKLLKKREKFYQRCHRMVDTSKKSVEEVVAEIIEFLSREKNDHGNGQIRQAEL